MKGIQELTLPLNIDQFIDLANDRIASLEAELKTLGDDTETADFFGAPPRSVIARNELRNSKIMLDFVNLLKHHFATEVIELSVSDCLTMGLIKETE